MASYGTLEELSQPSTSGENAETNSTQQNALVYKWWVQAKELVARLDSRISFTTAVQTLALIAVMTWFVLLMPLRVSSVSDFDLGWHLRSGEWIVQHHELPKTDPFSITGPTTPWVAYSWTFSVLIYEFAKNLDLRGVAAYSTLVWVASVLGIFVLVRRQGASFWRAIGLTLIAGFVFPRAISPRPGTITILLFIATLHVLLKERAKGYSLGTWVLPAIIWIWANVHVQFVYGLFIIGLFCVEPLLDRLFLNGGEPQKWSVRLWLVLLVSTVATLVNPYGFGPYQVILDFVNQPLLAGLVMETSAMSFTMPLHYVSLLAALGAIFMLANRRPVRPMWVILLLWGIVSGFRMERDIWLLVTVAVAFLAIPPENQQARPVSSRVWVYGTLGILLATSLALKAIPSNKYLVSLISSELPVGAVAYVHEHHLKGPLFNDYDWGGFLTYALPELPVAIDGRTNVHGQDEVGRSINTWALHPGWNRDPLLTNANLVIGTPRKALTSYLATDPHFKIVFDDGVGVVFKRVQPGRLGPQGKASE